MTVKDVICEALVLLGKDDIADAISGSVESGTEMSADTKRYAKLFTLIADSVVKELYSGYFPDVRYEEMTPSDGKFDLSRLSYPLVRLIKLTDIESAEEITGYEVKDGFVGINRPVNGVGFFYEYGSYDLKDLSDDIPSEKPYITSDVVVAGMVAEYFCTIGDTVNAALRQEKYENKIKLIRDGGNYIPYEPDALPARSVHLPCRRWV